MTRRSSARRPTSSPRLSKPFQRLHSEHDFPDPGIGLAIVRRIVERRGGRVWIEGDVGKGAICRFTLEAETEVRSPKVNQGQSPYCLRSLRDTV